MDFDLKPNELNDLDNGLIVGFFENPDKKALVKKEFNVSGIFGVEIVYTTQPMILLI